MATAHAKETKQLWDAFNPVLQMNRSDNQETKPMTDKEEDDSLMHVLPDVCQCGEGVIGPDGVCNECQS